MLRVYVGCFGSGLGHATRMLEVADRVSGRGGEVMFSSSAEVAKLVETRGYGCNDLPLADVRYSQEGNFSLRDTMTAFPLILARTYQQVYMEIANIRRFGPNVILSDSALPTLLAAKLTGVPVYTVLNQLNLASTQRRSAPVRLLSVGTSAGIGELWELSDEVLLPDLPPPYTISERNLWGSNVDKTRYVGFLSMTGAMEPDRLTEELAGDLRKKVFWQVSGPPKTRGPFLRKALETAASLPDDFVFIVSGGDPAGHTEATEIRGGWYYGWCRSPRLLLSLSDLVVSRAGHGTISQTIIAAKPSLLVPISRQPEQEGNATKATRLGIASCMSQDELTPESTLEAIKALLDSDAAERARALGEYASRFDGVEEVVRTLASAVS